ncbi:Ankyrin repeat and zinc finger domain-containing protein 1 [Hondaea fermentalgiana]|uniref:Ankyrin repeat and zinc finger domain-containing protein 1 n=1 Tax=Hondaea fermentalgiana TaxID=2315210 RepID=A0A2R5G3E0_9STRA|nr:Ankyrin repeat and zinc finger domain-containing protein 1 [Hondaea fermentalgiana]|eukprot:GBG25556.1 Ankyrin repeat and zinc finger domain-containing protein 1 [Hondaea fermentalgiana]
MAQTSGNLFELLRRGSLAFGEQAELESSSSAVTTTTTTTTADAQSGANESEPKSQEDAGELGSTSCRTCGLQFEDLGSQRAHFKTDFHRLNLKRRAAGKPALSESEAERDLSKAEDEESLSGSGSESEPYVGSDTEDMPPGNEEGGLRREHASMMVGLKVLGKEPSTLAWVPAAVALDKKREHEDVVALHERPLWVVLLHGAGHFAGVVLRNGREVVASKSFHRYVIRAKQGKAQSANDSAKGNAKSAGAGIRRYNEQMLKTEIGELLESWTAHISASSRIFVSISKTNQHIFFGNESVLSSKDPRVRRIPFPVRRPTVKGATEVGTRLATVHFEPESAYQERQAEVVAKQKAAEDREKARLARSANKASPPQPPSKADAAAAAADTESVEEPEDPELMGNMLEACQSGDTASVILCISQDAEVLNTLSVRDSGDTALHVAARSGHEHVVRLLLENGASPCIPNNRGELPFHCASERKSCKDAFRRFRGEFPDMWDYQKAAIPEAITDASEAAKKERQRERKKRQAQRKREEKQRQRKLEEEAAKRKEAEEAAALASAPSCASCDKKLLGPSSKWFNRLEYYYCSPECMQAHRRKLQADAALARFNK